MIASLVRIAGVAAVLLALSACKQGGTATALAAEVPPEAAAGAPVLHIVAFRFKTDAATRSQIDATTKAYAALQGLSLADDGRYRPLILSFLGGANSSTEQLSFGAKGVAQDRSTERTFVLTFGSVADRDYFVDKEPAHQRFKALVGPLLDGGADGVFVSDFQE